MGIGLNPCRRAVFLDRDGVLNRAIPRGGASRPPANLNELEILPGVISACEALRAAGFLLVVVTNQPDVARKTMRQETVELINRAIIAQLALDDIRVCYHDDPQGCSCRKPAPGLLVQAAADWQINLRASFMVGDRWKDIEAGRRAGCRTVLVNGPDAQEIERVSPDYWAPALLDAVGWIMDQSHLLKEANNEGTF